MGILRIVIDVPGLDESRVLSVSHLRLLDSRALRFFLGSDCPVLP